MTHRHGSETRPPDASLSISCQDCAMRCSTHCQDCLVTFLVGDDHGVAGAAGGVGAAPVADVLVLDAGEARVVDLLARAGLVPELRYELTA